MTIKTVRQLKLSDNICVIKKIYLLAMPDLSSGMWDLLSLLWCVRSLVVAQGFFSCGMGNLVP